MELIGFGVCMLIMAFLILTNGRGLSTEEEYQIDLEIKRARGRRKYQSRKERGY
jgi:hypothetical protein